MAKVGASRVEAVRFQVGGQSLVGHLHSPAGTGPHPSVVAAGPMTSVKEQVTGVYAQALAKKGIAALAIDHRHFGESGGMPRGYEHWQLKVEDLRTAVDYLTTRSDVRGDALGAVGVCLGAGYVSHLATSDKRLRAIGLVAGYYRDPSAMRAADPTTFDSKVEQGLEARTLWEQAGVSVAIPAASSTGDAAMQSADTVDYYTRRAAHPNYVNTFAVMSREHFVPFDVQSAAPLIGAPVVMVHSASALSPHWARKFYDALQAEKSVQWLESKGQTDFYDHPDHLVNSAADGVCVHLDRHLN